MEERPINFNLLHKDELEYEARIREAKPADTIIALKAQVRNLNKELPSDDILTCDLDVNTEVSIIQEKLDSLDKLITESTSHTAPLKSLNRIQTLAHHLFHRITRLDSDELASQIIVLRNRLDNKLVKLDNIMQIFRSSMSQSHQGSKSLSFSSVNNQQVVDNTSSDSNSSSVHKLNHRFNGKTCVKAFLQRLEELCLSRNISEFKLFNSSAELFTDEALCWYRGIRDEVHSWSDLKQVLLDEYLPADYDIRLMQEIRSRTQGPDENIINYLSIMQNYFGRLSRKVSDEDKLGIVLYNVRPFYTSQLALNPVDSWADLKRKCRLLDSARERCQNFKEPVKGTSSCLATDLSYKGSHSNVKAITKVASVQISKNNFCVRCRITGHTLQSCRAPFVLICYRCGEKGVTARCCTKCCNSDRTKNARS